MAKRRSPAVRAILKERGNPYWSLQLGDEAQESTVDARHDTRRAYFRALQNPHAFDYVFGEQTELESNTRATPRTDVVPSPRISKADFRKGCSSIFEQYIPPFENGRIRKHHRDFITRNENADPLRRASLLAQLSRYDLSKLSGIRPQFNRERELLTEQKLKQVEVEVDEQMNGKNSS